MRHRETRAILETKIDNLVMDKEMAYRFKVNRLHKIKMGIMDHLINIVQHNSNSWRVILI